MRNKILLALALVLGMESVARAQFWSGGSDPGRLRWYTMSTDNYKFIYPEGLDSLTRVYGTYMEQYRAAIGQSTGMLPGQAYKRPTPVLLHAYSGESNGSVAWAPKRMEFHTLPDAYSPWPISWEKSLAIHESRHLSQMQAGYRRWFKPLYWLLGEMAPGAYAGVYPGPHLLEGDAVVTETALTSSGRGRNADFLNYYMCAFDEGDWRDWYKWRYGSYKKYAPNYYALGYMTVAGARAFYDDPLFSQRYFDSTVMHPLRLGHLRRTLRDDTGEKRLRASGRAIMEQFHSHWQEEAAQRAPFIGFEQVSPSGSWFVQYYGGAAVGDDIYILKSGKLNPPELVKFDASSTESHIADMAAGTSDLAYDPVLDRLYWTETLPDLRWEEAASSSVKYLNMGSNKIRTLRSEGRLYNPDPSPDGSLVAAMEYPPLGGTFLVLIDSQSGSTVMRKRAPDSLQFVQPLWLSTMEIAISAVSDEGSSLWKMSLEEGFGRMDMTMMLPPSPVSLNGLENGPDGTIMFQSDRNGVNELYSYNPLSNELSQITSTKYGCGDGIFVDNQLYFTSLSRDGRYLYKARDTYNKNVIWAEIHKNPVAEKLSAQELELGGGKLPLREVSDISFSEPKRYWKLPHMFNIHSWVVPLYIDSDDVSSIAGDIVNGKTKLGATAMFQNVLGTASGSIGYSWGAASEGGMRSAGHIKLKYSGLYPVIELSANIGERAAVQYQRQTYTAESGDDVLKLYNVSFFYRDRASFNGYIRTYIPLNLSSGSWNRGLIPQLTYSASNDLYDKSEIQMAIDESFGGRTYIHFSGYSSDANVPMQQVTLSLSGYAIKKYTSAMPYPRWGLGAETGYRSRIGLTSLYPSAWYGYLYGYVPAFARNQGIRLSLLYQRLFDDVSLFPENTVSTSPRGFSGTSLPSYLASSTHQMKATIDYAIPLYFGDISVFSPVAYITHFMLKPHVDIALFSHSSGNFGMLASAGSDVTVHLANLIWIPYSTEVGMTFDYNFGPSFKGLSEAGVLNDKNLWHIGLVFKMDI